MSFLKNYPFNAVRNAVIVLPLVFLLGMGPVMASAAEREDLYHEARAAYQQNDCVVALKNFYAFYVLNESSLAEHPELKKSIESHMANCEGVLKLAVATNQGLVFTSSGIIVLSNELGSGFNASGMEIQEFMQLNEISIQQLMQNRQQIQE